MTSCGPIGMGAWTGGRSGMLSLRAAIALPGGRLMPGPRLYRGDGPPISRGKLPWECECACPREGELRWLPCGASALTVVREKGTVPARRAMSASPSCQCMASAARHGTAISSATLAHISGLNLWHELASTKSFSSSRGAAA